MRDFNVLVKKGRNHLIVGKNIMSTNLIFGRTFVPLLKHKVWDHLNMRS